MLSDPDPASLSTIDDSVSLVPAPFRVKLRERRTSMDVEELVGAADQPRRLIILNSPNNPPLCDGQDDLRCWQTASPTGT